MQKEVLLSWAREAYSKGDFQEAEGFLKQAIDRKSDPTDRLLYAIVLVRLRRPVEAEQLLDQLLAENPNLFEANTWMAVVGVMVGKEDKALQHAKKGVNLRPDDGSAYSAMGDCLLSLRRLEEASDAFTTATKFSPRDATAFHNLGLALGMLGRSSDALDAYRSAVELAPKEPRNYLGLTRILLRHSRVVDAIDALKVGLHQMPNNLALLGELASAYALGRNPVEAEKTYRQIIKLSPKTRMGYANWLQEEGRFAEGADLYLQNVDDNLATAQSLYGLVQVRKLRDEPALVAKLDGLAGDEKLNLRDRMYIGYALGRVSEEKGDFEKAAASFQTANDAAFRIYQQGRKFDVDELRQTNDKILEKARPLVGNPPSSNPERPIFIVGMIRSGTTLLEQIVSSHSKVSPTGELRFWVEEGPRLALRPGEIGATDLEELAREYVAYARLVAERSPYFTDKMPLNFGQTGLIHAALPQAKFLHLNRHPVDTCISIWTTFFGGGPQFVYNKPNIVAYYREYQRVVTEWKATLPPGVLIDVQYEDLIANREAVTRQVIDFCGLEWEDSCLHHEKNTSTIATPSRWQARQPIYRTSLERWRNYEPWLGEFSSLVE